MVTFWDNYVLSHRTLAWSRFIDIEAFQLYSPSMPDASGSKFALAHSARQHMFDASAKLMYLPLAARRVSHEGLLAQQASRVAPMGVELLQCSVLSAFQLVFEWRSFRP